TGHEARSPRLTGPPQPLTARWSDSQARRGECPRSPADPKRWQGPLAAEVTGQNIQFGAARASRPGDQVAAPNGGSACLGLSGLPVLGTGAATVSQLRAG